MDTPQLYSFMSVDIHSRSQLYQKVKASASCFSQNTESIQTKLGMHLKHVGMLELLPLLFHISTFLAKERCLVAFIFGKKGV